MSSQFEGTPADALADAGRPATDFDRRVRVSSIVDCRLTSTLRRGRGQRSGLDRIAPQTGQDRAHDRGALERADGREHADDAGPRRRRSRLHGRLDRDDREGERLAQALGGGRRDLTPVVGGL
jgi:hypothetical protein